MDFKDDMINALTATDVVNGKRKLVVDRVIALAAHIAAGWGISKLVKQFVDIPFTPLLRR